MNTGKVEVDLALLERTTDEVFSLNELRTRLAGGRCLRVKYGVDVTAPFLHIGHAVNLWMMRHLQDAGHKVVFLIGDFTTRIGDPTGKSQSRKVIPQDQIERNAEEFIRQVSLVLRTEERVFEVRRNSEWYGKMPLAEFLSLLSMLTHQRLIQRDMFQKRIEAGHEIFMHEMIYPVLQGYDSVMLQSDLTIVGSDQLFNELMGRFYQERFGQDSQVVMTTKITPGTDGKEKQSKSLGNYIALVDSPRDKFGKIMSIPDNLIVAYLQVYTTLPMEQVRAIEQRLRDGSMHPMDAKKQLAAGVVERYHGSAAADEEARWFAETFSRRQVPQDVPVVDVPAGCDLLAVLRCCLPGESASQLRRLLAQNGVRVNGGKPDPSAAGPAAIRDGDVLQVGRTRWFRLRTGPARLPVPPGREGPAGG